jgi:hypothetical protein
VIAGRRADLAPFRVRERRLAGHERCQSSTIHVEDSAARAGKTGHRRTACAM